MTDKSETTTASEDSVEHGRRKDFSLRDVFLLCLVIVIGTTYLMVHGFTEPETAPEEKRIEAQRGGDN